MTDDKIIDYVSHMGNKIVPSANIPGEKYTYFLYNRYKYIEKDKIEKWTLLNATNNSLDPYGYHVEKCGIDSFKKLEHTQIQICWSGVGEEEENEDDDLVEEDEENEDLIGTIYTNGNNEMVKLFNQMFVICLERDSVYGFRQCGHQCICEQCYQKNGDIDMLRCVVCRT